MLITLYFFLWPLTAFIVCEILGKLLGSLAATVMRSTTDMDDRTSRNIGGITGHKLTNTVPVMGLAIVLSLPITMMEINFITSHFFSK